MRMILYLDINKEFATDICAIDINMTVSKFHMIIKKRELSFGSISSNVNNGIVEL